MAGAERSGLPGHNAAAAGERRGLSFCLQQLLVFLQGSKVKSDLAYAVKNVFTAVPSLLAWPGILFYVAMEIGRMVPINNKWAYLYLKWEESLFHIIFQVEIIIKSFKI